MRIVIDSNIFFDNWYLRSAHFQLLSNYINNTDANILLPKVICEEVENNYRVGLKKTQDEIEKAVRNANNFCLKPFYVNLEQFPNDDFNFFKTARSIFNDVSLVEFEGVNQNKIFSKALNVKRPFRGKEKGYRDTLIWLSLLDYIKDNDIKDDIVLITNNSNDFFELINEKYHLHQDLKKDINNYEINNNFIVHNSLKSFIETSIKENLHYFQHNDIEKIEEMFGEVIEELLETDSRNYMNDLSLNEFGIIFEEAGFSPEITKLVREYYFEIFEGLEDTEIASCSGIQEGRLYIENSYNLRSCIIHLRFSLADYYDNKSQLEKELYNPEILDDEVILLAFTRCYYTSNFILDIENEAVEEFSIDSVFMK